MLFRFLLCATEVFCLADLGWSFSKPYNGVNRVTGVDLGILSYLRSKVYEEWSWDVFCYRRTWAIVYHQKNIQRRVWEVFWGLKKVSSLRPAFSCITREAVNLVLAWLAFKSVHWSKFSNALLNFSSWKTCCTWQHIKLFKSKAKGEAFKLSNCYLLKCRNIGSRLGNE